MPIRSLVLGVHVLCGVGWVALCAGVLLASAALNSETEAASFVDRVAPRLNRVGLACAALVPITGIGNLFFVIQARRGTPPAQFLWILACKVALLALMAAAQVSAATLTAAFQPSPGDGPQRAAALLRRLTRRYLVIVGAGALGVILGLWLAGI
ncbi:MAG TPA: hypothetical protein VFB15_02175 [Candidatus Binataceae bacterium]|nr:hypothetical protein [Candidatus Binataceae bacterium]